MNRQKREQQILDDALKTFVCKGYSKTSVADLVKGAKVSRGTFYLYFKSKEEIFDRLIDNFMGEVLFHASSFDAPLMRGDTALFSNCCATLSDTLTRYRFLARFMTVCSHEFSQSHTKKINSYIKQCYRIIEYNINEGIQQGLFKPVDPDVISHSVVGTLRAFLSEWPLDREGDDLNIKIHNLLEFVRHALCAENNAPIKPQPLLSPDFFSENKMTLPESADVHQH